MSPIDSTSQRHSRRGVALENKVFADYVNYVNPSFVKLLNMWGYGRVYVRAKDVWIWDSHGNRYLDLLSGFGVTNVGHNHPDIQDAITRFLHLETLQFNHISPSPYQADLAKRLALLLPDPLQMSLFSNSGAEAVEAAMKLARLATRRKGFVYCRKGYHGTTFATMSLMGSERMRGPLMPLLDNCVAIDFNNLSQLESALAGNKVAAFIVEPIQGEGGLNIPDDDYLRSAAEICRRHKTLLVIDEIQTGLGRSGDLFAFQAAGIVPDVLLLGKSLSGGMTPIAVTVTSKSWFDKAFGRVDRFDLHSSTFAGNAMACHVADNCLQIFQREPLLENSKIRGEQLLRGLQDGLANHPFVKSIRGRGLYIAIEFSNGISGVINWFMAQSLKLQFSEMYGQWIALRLLEAGIICQPAASSWNVIKLMPPLSIGEKEVEWATSTICNVVNSYDSGSKVIKESSIRLLKKNKSPMEAE